MRHFFASILINEGIDVATVSALLGHADTSTTLSIYCHAFMQAQAKAIEVVANTLNFKKEAWISKMAQKNGPKRIFKKLKPANGYTKPSTGKPGGADNGNRINFEAF